MPASRPLRWPAPDFHQKALPFTAVQGLDLLRIHGRSWPAVQFRKAISHRFSHPDAPGGLLYLSHDLETCIWECHGDAVLEQQAIIFRPQWEQQAVARIQSPATFRLCDLTSLETRSALKVDLSALTHPELELPQAWGLAIQTHPEKVDGFFYISRFTDRTCLVLFDRGGGAAATLTTSPLNLLSELPEGERFLKQNNAVLI